jgi:tetratricopeptide (TPR) repeat protein
MRFRVPLVCICAGIFLFASGTNADTIVLKNGRRIAVIQASENGDQVTGQTADGEITLPKSLVAKIERGDTGSANRSTFALEIARPNSNDAAEKDSGPNSSEILALDRTAENGSPEAALKAAAAHEAAARAAERRGDIPNAIAEEEKARRLAPAEPNVLLNLAYYHLRQSEFTSALDLIRLVRKVDPDSVDAARLAGWADYGLNKIADAVTEWKRAQAMKADADVARALERAQRDQQAESEFREGQSNHFVVRYSGKAEPGLARAIVDTLEEHFTAIRDTLNFTPAEPIGVILYTNQEFADITRAPGWVGAINDGRIRIPVQGVTVVSDQLSRMLKHELTHSFLQQKTRGRCPTWLNEGVAQWMEGTRSSRYARALASEFDAGHISALRDLESSWMNLSSSGAGLAYAWAEAVVEKIVEGGGTSDLNRLIDAVSDSTSAEAAVRSALHMDYSVLAQETAEYLRRESSSFE